MRFSLLTLLGFTFLVSLALLAWRTGNDVQRERARLQMVEAENKLLETQVRLDHPVLYQAYLNTEEQYDSLRAMRISALVQFDLLREKYSGIETRGPGVLSVRGLPTVPIDDKESEVAFRILVPEDRPVWLKFGVHSVPRHMSSSRSSDDEDDLLRGSPFERSGPFAMQLAPGEQMLKVIARSAREGRVPIEIMVNDRTLLSTSCVAEDVIGSNRMHISSDMQIDYASTQKLPWLLSISMRLATPAELKPDTYAFSIWLSDRSSNFVSFPGE